MLLTPLAPARSVVSKIVFPSQPSVPPAPSLSSSVGGALGATTYFVKMTWVIQTQDGATLESEPSNETSLAVAANNLLNVAIPNPPNMPYAVIGANVYVSGSSGTEVLQTTSPAALGSVWIEPTSGLIAGAPPPSGWGNSLIFTYPGREFPYYNPDWKGHDEFSTAGWQQSITWYVDQLMEFSVPYVASGDDAAAWKQFLSVAIQRVPFDFYQDSTSSEFVSLILTDTNPKIAWKAPGLWALDVKARQVILSQ